MNNSSRRTKPACVKGWLEELNGLIPNGIHEIVPGEATRVSLYERSFLDSFAVDAKLTTDGREEASNWMTLAAHPSEDAGAAFAGGAP